MNYFFKININNKLYNYIKSLYNLFKVKFSKPLIGIILPIIIVMIWHFLAATDTIRHNLLPPPHEVINEILILANDGSLLSHITITITRVFYGFIVGGIAATTLGILTGVSPFIRSFFDPTIQALKAKKIAIKGIIFSGNENNDTESIILKMSNIPMLFRINEEMEFNKEIIMNYAQQIKL